MRTLNIKLGVEAYSLHYKHNSWMIFYRSQDCGFVFYRSTDIESGRHITWQYGDRRNIWDCCFYFQPFSSPLDTCNCFIIALKTRQSSYIQYDILSNWSHHCSAAAAGVLGNPQALNRLRELGGALGLGTFDVCWISSAIGSCHLRTWSSLFII